jgi:hypothetical protein
MPSIDRKLSPGEDGFSLVIGGSVHYHSWYVRGCHVLPRPGSLGAGEPGRSEAASPDRDPSIYSRLPIGATGP